ncbi:hypothetical protein [Haloferax sulfurifontis]|jgi:hypothetical protein|uniref:Uncharacterized protein n=1 Tax=Haloferax sulfurifontis TaxID=255616 RepID=A0A830DZ28_9EURY|nr:hypothetical protein [Haloferax sulfurifontis]GGC73127.1 hypothetical protein GCM10007209_38810 [Haloferax sulfurifontis]
MSSQGTISNLNRTSTVVPVNDNKQLTVEPGSPWPSAYRGSKYSLVSSRLHGDVVQWSHMGDVQALTDAPRGLQDELRRLGKQGGYGSFKLTASGEVLTKVPADNFPKSAQAPVNRGHIPVYVGKLNGQFDFEVVSNDPATIDPGEIQVWRGLPFKHGETWAVCSDDVLRWTWRDYYFESAFDHPDIVTTYKRLRPMGGRIYINEHGHIWGGIDRSVVPAGEQPRVAEAFTTWQQSATSAEKRLVERRLERTQSQAVENGLLPVHLGHLSQFDDGMVPKPVVTDKRYFRDTVRDPDA